LFSSCSLQNQDSLSIVHVGENAMKIKTGDDSNNITESADPLHDKPSTGMSGFL